MELGLLRGKRDSLLKALSLSLEKAKELGIQKALVVCDKDNIGSLKTISKNGGDAGSRLCRRRWDNCEKVLDRIIKNLLLRLIFYS